MLTEGLVLVPFWRSLAASDFFSWYGAHGARLAGFFGPVTWLAALVGLAAAGASLWSGAPGRWAALGAAGLMLLAVATFFVYFGRANASFTAGVAELPSELTRWASWHWLRTALSLGAVAAALAALRPAGDDGVVAARPASRLTSP